MGWTIYRIWSTDWIKDHKTEEEKLINVVEKALGRTIIEDDDDFDNSNEDAVIPIIEIEEKVEPSEMLKTDDIHPPKTGISVHFSCSLS